MNIRINRDTLLKPLQAVVGVVERKQTLPILSNVLLKLKDQELSLTATDLEVELQARALLDQPVSETYEITVPGRKFLDICRSLPEQSILELSAEKDKLILRSGRSRFSLLTLPSQDFPLIRETTNTAEFTMGQKDLCYLTHRTYFAMAQQDVRYYLNGMLLEVNKGKIKAVATDGHRLALNTIDTSMRDHALMQVILPRKGVGELMRLLTEGETSVAVKVSNNHVRVSGADFSFISKLVDGRFPDYEKVLPKGGDKSILLDRDVFKHALTRASILSNEKFRGVRLQLRHGLLKIIANNPEQEEAEEEINIDYQREELEMGFNVTYLLDILNTVEAPQIKMTFSDPNSSVLIEEQPPKSHSLFVVMPMRL